MVASDLDGTIVCLDGSISRRTVDALARCERAGVDVVLVTARPPRWMPDVARQLASTRAGSGTAICANGALTYDLATGEVVDVSGMDVGTVDLLAARLRSCLPGAMLAFETPAGLRREPGFPDHRPDGSLVRVGPWPHLLADAPVVTKLLCRVPGRAPAPGMDGAPHGGDRDGTDTLLRIARQALGADAEPSHSDPGGGLLEIGPPGVSKATTLARLAASRGIDAADVVAFGDMPNDVPMLRWAGTGYAVADGHPEAIAAADAVCPPCTRDGVAQVLEGLLARGAGVEAPG